VAYPNEPITVVVDRMALRRCVRILVLSEYSRSLLMADDSDQSRKIRRVSGGVETKSFSPGANAGRAGATRSRSRTAAACDRPEGRAAHWNRAASSIGSDRGGGRRHPGGGRRRAANK
jgi:hypothetical protein